jgi:hypothetical protein
MRPSRSSPSRCASPRTGAPTCARSSPPTGPARGAWASWPIASAWTSCARPPRRPRLRRAAHARVPRGSRRRDAHRGRPARGGRRRPRAAGGATIAGDELTLDFSGSAAQHAGNLNCPLAVTASACLFAVRVLTDPDIPPSAGAYRRSRCSRPRARCSTRARRGGRRLATSRPPRAWPTSCSAPSAAPWARGP